MLGREPVDEFLFDTRAGFCEHFSSAFVFLLRAAGVPARVVTGYQGGEVNTVDRIITVRQADAHAWAEAYLPGRGWLRLDPTAAAVPGRIESGLARAVRQGEPVPLLLRPQLEWLRAVRYNWEALAHRWNVMVLGYNPELPARADVEDRHARRRLAQPDRGHGLRARRLHAAAARLVAAPPGAPRPRAARLAGVLPQAGRARRGARPRTKGRATMPSAPRAGCPRPPAPIQAIAALYVGARYGRDATREQVADLRRRVRALRLA